MAKGRPDILVTWLFVQPEERFAQQICQDGPRLSAKNFLTADCKLYVAIEVLRTENFDSRVFSLDVKSEILQYKLTG